jgi:hypothetical protein
MKLTTHLGGASKTAANKGFAIAGVPRFADTFVQGGSSVLRIKFSAKTPRHRKPPKRWAKYFDAYIFASQKTVAS